jgi:IclR family mhp operon transcriptional activator
VIVATRVGDLMIVRASTTDMTALSYRHYRFGHTMPLLFSTSGRAYLAFCDADERRLILEGLKVSQADNTAHMTSVQFAQAMEQIRTDGFTVQKFNLDAPAAGRIASLSAPIIEHGKSVGALTLIFFASAMSIVEAVARYSAPVMRVAEAISRDLETTA